jgi:hypothetical protein
VEAHPALLADAARGFGTGVGVLRLDAIAEAAPALAGMGLPLLGALLGHRAAATTARYAHLHTAPLRAASDEIGAKIAAALLGERRTDHTDGEGVTH